MIQSTWFKRSSRAPGAGGSIPTAFASAGKSRAKSATKSVGKKLVQSASNIARTPGARACRKVAAGRNANMPWDFSER